MTNEPEVEPRAKTRMRREIVDAMRGLHKVGAGDELVKIRARHCNSAVIQRLRSSFQVATSQPRCWH